MANKTTKNTKSEIDEITAEDVEVTTTVKASSAPKAAKKYMPSDLIECRSVTGGELILVGQKSGLKYTWADYGDTAWVEFQDLQAMHSRKATFLTKPRFIIEDAELVAQWGSLLKPIYDKINSQTIDEFFALSPARFAAQLKNLPDGLKDTVKTKAVQMIQNDELYDIRKVRAIDEAWGTDFVKMFMQ